MTLPELLDNAIQAAIVVRQFGVAFTTYVLGFASLGWGLFILGTWNSPRRQHGAGAVVGRVFVGTLFINSATWLNSVALTVTGYGVPAQNASSLVGSGGSVPQQIFTAALVWVATLGVLSILRGTHLLIVAGDSAGRPTSMQEDPLWTGLIHIVAGAIGVNLSRFVSGLI